MRRYTFRQFRGYLDAVRRRRHTDRAFEWSVLQNLIAVQGGRLEDYPDYVGPEEGQDPADFDRQVERQFEGAAQVPVAGGVARRLGVMAVSEDLVPSEPEIVRPARAGE